MKRMSSLILFSTVFVSACGIVDASAKSGNAGSALVGNTIHGFDVANGEEYWMYLRPDGTGANIFTDGDTSPFSWSINGNAFCFAYAEGTECSTYKIRGSSGIETSVSGTGVGASGRIQIMSGNPKGL